MSNNSFKTQLLNNSTGPVLVGYLSGLVLGLAYGVVFQNLGVGILLGVFLGYILASTFEKLRRTV